MDGKASQELSAAPKAVPSEGEPPAFAALAALPRSMPLDARELGRLLGRHPKSIQLAARRGELPSPFPLLARKVWTVGAILDHFGARQAAAARMAKNFGKGA